MDITKTIWTGPYRLDAGQNGRRLALPRAAPAVRRGQAVSEERSLQRRDNMADPKWTPGPWEVTNFGTAVKQASASWADGGIAIVVSDHRSNDAHLIAAAPDLYEDLVNLGNYVEWLLTYILDWDEKAAKAHVEGFTTSLRKARGETAGD